MECSLFIRLLNLSPGNCLPGYSLLIRFPSLPPGDCWQGVQSLFYLFRNLHLGDFPLGCIVFYGFQTYLQGDVFAVSQPFFFSVLSVCFHRLTEKQTRAVRISLYLSISFSLSFSLSLAEHIASGQEQTRSLYISRPKFNRTNMTIDR